MYLAVAVKRRAAAAELRRFWGSVMPSIPKRLFPNVQKVCGIPYLRVWLRVTKFSMVIHTGDGRVLGLSQSIAYCTNASLNLPLFLAAVACSPQQTLEFEAEINTQFQWLCAKTLPLKLHYSNINVVSSGNYFLLNKLVLVLSSFLIFRGTKTKLGKYNHLCKILQN